MDAARYTIASRAEAEALLEYAKADEDVRDVEIEEIEFQSDDDDEE